MVAAELTAADDALSYLETTTSPTLSIVTAETRRSGIVNVVAGVAAFTSADEGALIYEVREIAPGRSG